MTIEGSTRVDKNVSLRFQYFENFSENTLMWLYQSDFKNNIKNFFVYAP